ncbi:MAG: Rnf-Nqr domain containing protein [Acutalibacteraceae bacterium]|jgi:electron transport complex protein RnfA
MSELLVYLLAAALLQNLVLTTGFGSSMMMRILRRPTDLLPFGALLTLFSVSSSLIVYPLDGLLGTGYWAKLFRPLIMVAITAALYILLSLLIRRSVRLYRRVGHLLGLAAFNNVVVGVALILNHQFAATLPVAIGFSAGSCLGFTLLALVLVQATRRADHPAMPDAFRGLPSTLLYMGILALALMGFSGSVSFV